MACQLANFSLPKTFGVCLGAILSWQYEAKVWTGTCDWEAQLISRACALGEICEGNIYACRRCSMSRLCTIFYLHLTSPQCLINS